MMHAMRLRTDSLVEPIGLGDPNPQLSWNVEDGLRQTAYRIRAERVAPGGTSQAAWDTGRVESDRMVGIAYAGEPLRSRDRIVWRVKLWDEAEREGEWSLPATFEMGLLEAGDWVATWMEGDLPAAKGVRQPVDCFRKSFLLEGEVLQARLYATACGIYEASLNERDCGTWRFAPGFTDYRKRLQYQTYDVTRLLVRGENVLSIDLADGWYRGSIGCYGVRDFYGDRTKALAQLEIRLADGSTVVVASGDGFAWSDDGPVREADPKDGEIVEAGRVPSYRGRARSATFPLQPTASDNVPVEEHERFEPVLITTPKGATVLDFQQNIAGTVEFRIEGTRAGQVIDLRFGEILDEAGEFTQKNLQYLPKKSKRPTPLQRIHYVCRGGTERYRMRFAAFGFRYALVETDVRFEPKDFTAVAVYSSMGETGAFTCSNPLVDRLVENTRWSMKGNFLDVPTDCPTREHAPWTGDAQVFFTTGAYLMDTDAFFRKWMRDIRDRQAPDGKVQCIVPSVGNEGFVGPMDGSVGWADAAVLVPYRHWKLFGDPGILAENYAAMSRYGRFMIGRTNRTGFLGRPFRRPHRKYIVNAGQGFGEWNEPREVYAQGIKDFIHPLPEEGTAYLALTMSCLAEIATELGHAEDARLWAEYAAGARTAYDAVIAPRIVATTTRPAKLVRPLAFGLLGDVQRRIAAERLVEFTRARRHRIGTGFLSTPFVLPVLAETGHLDDAYRMLEQEESPGWLYEVKRGATTIWEDWEGVSSQNHYSPGAVVEWLFTTVGGIRLDGRPNRFTVAPRPGGTLTYAETSYLSIYGRISVRWTKREDGRCDYVVDVPANTEAEVRLPDGTTHAVGAGTHAFAS